jgi:hypothetical protein
MYGNEVVYMREMALVESDVEVVENVVEGVRSSREVVSVFHQAGESN